MTFITQNGWNVSEFEFQGFKYQIKSKGMHGMKLHVFNPGIIGEWTDTVLFTDRYRFVKPQQLHDIARKVISRIIALINKENGMLKCDIKFDIDKKRYSFSIVHNLPDVPGLRIEDAVQNWIFRAEEYTGADLCRYIASKDLEFIAVTLNNYLKKGFKYEKK